MTKQLNSILVKPSGPDCNLDCTYCFYLEKQELFPESKQHRMSEATLEEVIRLTMCQSGRNISFGWQGGEPSLMGLNFYEKAVEYQKQYGAGKSVGNGFQTNGILLDQLWAKFFKQYNFLIGLSIDGPEHIHDRYRISRGGGGSWSKVDAAARMLLSEGVEANAISVVNDYSVRFPAEIYDYHKQNKMHFMQFIPIVERDRLNPNVLTEQSVSAEAYGQFLISIFDLWRADFDGDQPLTSVRWLDAIFHRYVGLNPPDCTLEKECGTYLVVEHNGDVYSCDFFVENIWKLGSVKDGNLLELLNGPVQSNFGAVKSVLPECCAACPWLVFCCNGCPKDRTSFSPDGKPLNHLCESYKIFFSYADNWFTEFADEWMANQAEREDAEFKLRQKKEGRDEETKIGRNDPCPCGSGKKFKKCCGR